ncbi:MAG: hypothetical protein KKD07_01025 [Candidatus Omnitrophica bacterium]|nr:hypothetical protein [Candidatus Omnitrophota bacterium]MBU1996291.1 hypothetical protein [Candidatus Omnitrophota bacterium]MBU4333005.1 hypothetical protein [Candidatus Omnitrophota bacterium]
MNIKASTYFLLIIALFIVVGCESMNKGASKVGEGVGKVTKVGDSVTEGAVDGYLGKDQQNNPYGR